MAFSISNLFNGGNNAGGADTGGGNPAPQDNNNQQSGAPAQQPAPAQPGNLPNQQPADPTKIDGANNPPPNPDASPLDQFKDLWEPTNTNEGEPAPMFEQLDPTKVQEAMNRADFSGAISQENLSAISEGGEAAMRAFSDSLNAVARQVMSQSTLVANKMIETQVTKALESHQAKLPDMLKKQTLKDNLSSTNPLFKNPAIKPVAEAVQMQLAAKYPDASVAEVNEMVSNFLTTMSGAFNPNQPSSSDAAGLESTDWSVFLGEEN